MSPIGTKQPTTKQEIVAANIELLIEQLAAGHPDQPHCTDNLKTQPPFAYTFPTQ